MHPVIGMLAAIALGADPAPPRRSGRSAAFQQFSPGLNLSNVGALIDIVAFWCWRSGRPPEAMPLPDLS